MKILTPRGFAHLAVLLFCTASAFAAVPYRFGAAGYTFNQKSLDETLAILKKANVRFLCVKDFHLKYDATDAEIAAFKAKCAAAGVEPYALGPHYTKDAAAVRAYFAFAKRFGAKTIVGVPYEPGDEKDTWRLRKASRKQLEEIDRLVKQYDIRYAIHNHGPAAPEMYPDADYGWNLIKDLDPRIGFCLDVGWEFGCGKDPAATIRQYGNRIYDVHVKDFERGKADGAAVPLGCGKLDYPSVMRALADIGYTGVCALEYERDFGDNLAAVAACAGYFRGVAQCVRAKAVMRPVPADANTLTAEEKAEGYALLFDGKNLPKDTFVGTAWELKTFPKRGWFVKDGALTMRPMHLIKDDGTWGDLPPEDMKLGGGGDIVTLKKYRDFVFKFDFRMTEKANSGVKYFYDEKFNGGTCEEYQILDRGHPDYTKGRDGNRQVAALYDIYPASDAEKVLKPLGEWNSGMIVTKGAKVEHWLNGVKVLEYVRDGEAFRQAVNASKYATWGKDADGRPQPWGELKEGRILLQDHTDSVVSFCNLKIRNN